ncbi:MAG: hypothetical protein JWO36_1143 [Myxococcales bacterium]|nr:hypothetical protein [Myxococcales bacterium]
MTYRDRSVSCPRCGVELIRKDAREAWSCVKCKGALLDVGELVRELLLVAPDLLPEGGTSGITTLGRRTVARALACPMCAAPMEPVFLGGVDLDRCYDDNVFWFDAGELGLVLEVAQGQREERHKPWLARLFENLFG